MALRGEAPGVLREALREARRLGASPREMKALVLAGLVESGLQHERYSRVGSGDRDSVGFLQQRPSQGWGPAGESVARDTEQFLAAARKANRGFHGSAGQLAQAVQRSAFPGRYDARSGEAERLLRQFGGGGDMAEVDGGAARAPELAALRTATEAGGGSPGQQLAAVLSAQELAAPMKPASVGLAAPVFAAQPVAPAGAKVVASAGRVRESPGAQLSAALSAVRGLGGVEVTQEPSRAAAASGGAQGAVSAGGEGRVRVTGPNPGRLKASVLRFAERVSAVAGLPITAADGTGHSRLTVNGRVSQHSTGNATDIPASGRRLIRLGQAALIAAGMPEREARKQTGGLFNVNGHQVIFNTQVGGDHTTHLHISAR